jgi:hypothetical protein
MSDLYEKHKEKWFHENCISKDDDRLSLPIVKFITFHVMWITNNDAWGCSWINLCSISRQS